MNPICLWPLYPLICFTPLILFYIFIIFYLCSLQQTRRVLRLVAVVGTIPAVGVAVGCRIRSLQAAEANASGEHRVYRVCDVS